MQPHKVPMGRKQFRIGDLADELKVKKFVIRFWEKEFDLKSGRSGGGQRFYTSDDLRTFLLIKDLLYKQGFTIAGAKKQLDMLLAQKAHESLAVQPHAEVVEAAETAEAVVQDSVHDVTPAESLSSNDMASHYVAMQLATRDGSEVQDQDLEVVGTVPAQDHAVHEEFKSLEEVKIEMVQPGLPAPSTMLGIDYATKGEGWVELSNIEIISNPQIEHANLGAHGEPVEPLAPSFDELRTSLKQDDAPLVSSGAELFQTEEQEESVTPATMVPCACSTIGQELRGIKDKLLALKQRVEGL